MLSSKEIKRLAEEIVKKQQELEPFLTITEAAKFLGVSVSFMEKHPEIPHSIIYTHQNREGRSAKKSLKRYQKYRLVQYMNGEL